MQSVSWYFRPMVALKPPATTKVTVLAHIFTSYSLRQNTFTVLHKSSGPRKYFSSKVIWLRFLRFLFFSSAIRQMYFLLFSFLVKLTEEIFYNMVLQGKRKFYWHWRGGQKCQCAGIWFFFFFFFFFWTKITFSWRWPPEGFFSPFCTTPLPEINGQPLKKN